jgi:uncharacterized protein (DUF2147 family)
MVMTNPIVYFLIFATLSVASLVAQPAKTDPADAILGEWINEAKDAKFKIYKQSNRYYGKIVWGTGTDPYDIRNPDPKLRQRALVGLTILEDFVYKAYNTWENGSIYDPKNGKTYSCKMTLKSHDKLHVRGYVGISMLGRTEVWTRIK